MSKGNNFLRIGVLMLIATLASSGVFVGSGTFAKYTAEKKGAAEARVAHFHVEVDNSTFLLDTNDKLKGEFSNDAGTETLIVTSEKLGRLLQPTISAGEWANHPGGDETDTITKIDGSLIAPGTGGRLSFVFTNKSEVSVCFWLDEATSKVTLKPAGGPAPLTTAEIKFAYDDGSGTAPANTAFGPISGALGGFAHARSITLGPWDGTGTPPSATIGVYWQWPFEQNRDETDTALGEVAGPRFSHAASCKSGPGGTVGALKTKLSDTCAIGCKKEDPAPGEMEVVLKIRAQQID